MFSRPAEYSNSPSGWGHLQLFNPANSGVVVHVKQVIAWSSAGVQMGYVPVSEYGMFSDASFPESRGLPRDPDVGPAYSQAHARRQVLSSPIDFGQLVNFSGGASDMGGFILPPGIRSLVVRTDNNNYPIRATFIWEEVAV